jgi:hypothetical protein
MKCKQWSQNKALFNFDQKKRYQLQNCKDIGKFTKFRTKTKYFQTWKSGSTYYLWYKNTWSSANFFIFSLLQVTLHLHRIWKILSRGIHVLTSKTLINPRLANSTLTVCVFVKTSAAISLTVWRRVLPRGGSRHPMVVGIVSKRCCQLKRKNISKHAI